MDYGQHWPSRDNGSDDGLSGGAIAGIIVGAVVVACCIGGLGYLHTTGRLLNRKGGGAPGAAQDDAQLEMAETA